jgi:hypothetical protein
MYLIHVSIQLDHHQAVFMIQQALIYFQIRKGLKKNADSQDNKVPSTL